MQNCPNCQVPNRDDARFCSRCGSLLVSEIRSGYLSPGELLQGRYHILRTLARGGMGTICLAQDAKLFDRQCVLKEMLLDYFEPADIPEFTQMFKREAELLAKLDHPNIPRVSDFFTDRSRHYLVMDFVQGQNLEELLTQRGTPFPENQVREWAVQLCDVLGYLHAQSPPIIFRDLKPGNIMLDKAERIKLIDFGIARIYSWGKRRDTMTMGTPGYAASEQYGTGQTDARSDIYSLGLTLLRLVSGHDPAASPFNHPPARQINPTVSAALEKIIQRATMTDPNHRFGAAAEFKAALIAVPSVPFVERPLPRTVPRLVPATFSGRQSLIVAARQVLGEQRKGLVQGLVKRLSQHDVAHGVIVPLIGFRGVGTSYVATRVRDHLASQRSNLNIVAYLDFSVPAADVLEELLRALKRAKGGLKGRMKKSVDQVHRRYVEGEMPHQVGRKDVRGHIKVEFPIELSVKTPVISFSVGKPAKVERQWTEGTSGDSGVEGASSQSSKQQSDLAVAMHNLAEFLLEQGAKISFIFDKIAEKDVLKSVYRLMRIEGTSSLVVLDVGHYYDWFQEGHVLAQHSPVYVPCLWESGEELCYRIIGDVEGVDDVMRPAFAKFIEYRGRGCPGRVLSELRRFYVPPKQEDSHGIRRVLTGRHYGSFKIDAAHLAEFETYGRLQSLVEESVDDILPRAVDEYRYDLARLQMYDSLDWMVQRAQDDNCFELSELETRTSQVVKYAPKSFKASREQVGQNLVELLEQAGLLEKDGAQINSSRLLTNPAVLDLLSCPDCQQSIRLGANFCGHCGAQVT